MLDSLLVQSLGTKVQIRHFESEDASSVEFVVLSVLHEWGALPTAKDQQELEALQSQNPFDAFFVAEDPDVGVIGCAGIVRYSDDTCELRKIYLLQRFRGKGIGRQLLDACTQEARQRAYKRIRFESNTAMSLYTPFYLRNGFAHAPDEVSATPNVEKVYYKVVV